MIERIKQIMNTIEESDLPGDEKRELKEFTVNPKKFHIKFFCSILFIFFIFTTPY